MKNFDEVNQVFRKPGILKNDIFFQKFDFSQ